mgnify:CR=1 FL=1
MPTGPPFCETTVYPNTPFLLSLESRLILSDDTGLLFLYMLLIKKNSIVETCFACPTIFDFKDIDGNELYFRLRWGHYRLCNNVTEEILLSGEPLNGEDGVISEDEMIKLIQIQSNGNILFV